MEMSWTENIGLLIVASLIFSLIDYVFDKNPFSYKGFLRKSLLIFIGLFIVLVIKKYILPPPPKPALRNEEPNVIVGGILGIVIFGTSLYLSIRTLFNKKK